MGDKNDSLSAQRAKMIYEGVKKELGLTGNDRRLYLRGFNDALAYGCEISKRHEKTEENLVHAIVQFSRSLAILKATAFEMRERIEDDTIPASEEVVRAVEHLCFISDNLYQKCVEPDKNNDAFNAEMEQFAESAKASFNALFSEQEGE